MGNAYPAAPGIRNIGDDNMRYIPDIWSINLLIKFYERTVLGAIANTEYEGEISQQGDTVRIRSIPDITIRDHQKGQNLVHEQPVSTPTSLEIDRGKYWAFSTNVVDDKQTDIKRYTDVWMEDAAKRMKIAIDTEVLATIPADADPANQGATAGAISANIDLGVDGGTSVVVTESDIVKKIVKTGQVLGEQNVPGEGRWMVVPEWFASLIKLSDLKGANVTGDAVSPLRNGRIGMVNNMTIFVSNLLDITLDGGGAPTTKILFGTNDALTFASQLTDSDQMKNPNAFGTLFRGLNVYGFEVIKPEALGVLYAKEG